MLRSKLALLVLLRRRKRQKKGRRYWVHPLWRNRPELGAYFALLPQLKVNPDKFFDYMRMNPEVDKVLDSDSDLCRRKTDAHNSLSGTGESYRSLSFQFRMGCMTVCGSSLILARLSTKFFIKIISLCRRRRRSGIRCDRREAYFDSETGWKWNKFFQLQRQNIDSPNGNLRRGLQLHLRFLRPLRTHERWGHL
uniref:Uncharacterized protein n=1 Tax=Ditylenchus dipsaci TaxID=166011 RepID=A0A915D6X6_9BILA